ncbi:zinc-finger homeodomain protein 10-like [Andrographis paniculata]|uniref:zinc-finger homeodomain protein 10-like n=1 Tax=Andrographis paniculata TaxID=175694 RepID=UPI0021E9585F|nr:zinc-finger homeodomain protein 10-like [Andrographis paniculata]
MDLTNSTVKTPEPESEPQARVQAVAPPFSNGVLKRHPPLSSLHPPVVVAYKECLKNHAAALGGHAVDGCGEFMPSPATKIADPTSLKCAACGCHRNFHRREPEVASAAAFPALEYRPHHRHHPLPPPGNSGDSADNSPSPPPISSSYYPTAPHVLLALGHVTPDGNPQITTSGNPNLTPLSTSSCRKRFRTKFSQNQKEKMLELAGKVGWKMQKRDDDLINEFCGEIGVDRSVFKVWMHNNKNTFSKKDLLTAVMTPSAAVNGNGFSYSAVSAAPAEEDAEEEERHHFHGGDEEDDRIIVTNGSASTSN